MPKKTKKKKKRKRSKRTTADGCYYAVNVYIHETLLDRLDDEAAKEDRTRRAQLERVLCLAFGIDSKKLSRAGAKR